MLYDSTKSLLQSILQSLEQLKKPDGTTKRNLEIHVFTKCTRCRGRCTSRIEPTD